MSARFGDPLDRRDYLAKLADWLTAARQPPTHDCEPIHPGADHCRCGADLAIRDELKDAS